MTDRKRLAVVTGASTGIGLELARICATEGHDLVICAEEAAIHDAAAELGALNVAVEAVQADLGTPEGIDALWRRVEGRDVDYLLANAGIGLSGPFLDLDRTDIAKVIALNVSGTTELLHRFARRMRDRGTGRVLVTGSIAGFFPGSFHAVYNASKAYLDSLSYALQNELKESPVTVTCLMPGLTETEFFERAGMTDTPAGRDDGKDDPAVVARKGYEAMMNGRSGVVTGLMNKVQTAFAGLIPDQVLAQMHRRLAEPDDLR
ncbi:SDR family NAD(P)-dependent oxidoreductase [Rhodobacteraceae bacterium 2CG4]|uniref:SDR family NAD(P)-dependent oxidoreductase n=1 Tax=Halovulum marinum TaxID=2662447 RepID=A0A6L5Z1V6_9RHOB|nr:SDR family NAD(P)-dependent oxidoreductase [Halovulum marinum]MSU90279.1 SDR family NAD(P)-dependent oxidoreductase [Halovulum marinum]